MSSIMMERARRQAALLLLKLARLTLQGIIAFHVSGLPLRCFLSLVSALERLGARLLPGHRDRRKRAFCDMD